MQNSLNRLFEGLVSVLVEDVAPHIEDPYARAQTLAAAEVIANLATRVEWDRRYLTGWLPDVQTLLRDAVDSAEPGRLPRAERVLASCEQDPETSAREHLCAAAEVQAWVAEHAGRRASFEPALRALADMVLGDELDRLRRVR